MVGDTCRLLNLSWCHFCYFGCKEVRFVVLKRGQMSQKLLICNHYRVPSRAAMLAATPTDVLGRNQLAACGDVMLGPHQRLASPPPHTPNNHVAMLHAIYIASTPVSELSIFDACPSPLSLSLFHVYSRLVTLPNPRLVQHGCVFCPATVARWCGMSA